MQKYVGRLAVVILTATAFLLVALLNGKKAAAVRDGLPPVFMVGGVG